jgi:protein-tyrosine phosphatase
VEESVEFCRIARADGVATTVATPHVRPDTYPNTPETIRQAWERLREGMEAAGVEHDVVPGAEVYLRSDLPQRVASGEAPTYAGHGKHLLLELPAAISLRLAEEVVEQLRGQGVVPVIAHPERCSAIMEDPEMLYRLVRSGALSQVTGHSVVGVFGSRPKACARLLLRSNLVHMVGSDAHTLRHRRPVLSEAAGEIASLLDEEEARRLCVTNARTVLEGGDVEAREPVVPQRGGLFARLLGR